MEKKLLTQDDYENNRKRNNKHTLRTTDAEEKAIQSRRAETSLNFNDFMIHMAIHGLYVKQDFTSVRELSAELNKIGVNINQIAHKVNADNYVQNEDLKYLRNEIDKMWEALDKLFKRDMSERSK